MSQVPFHLMHVLNLNTLGGVETLYMNFLEYSWKNDSALPITSIHGKRAHPFFQKKMKEIRYSPFYERYIYNLYLPKWMRGIANFKRWMLTSVSSTPLTVFWNIIEQKKSATPFLYYEHGASWDYKNSPSHKKFWQDCVGTICVSQAAQAMLQYKTSLSCPSYIVPNPLRPDIHIKPNPKTSPQGPLRLGFIGRLLPIKAPGIAIQTLFELNSSFHIDSTLTIIGVGKEKPFLEGLVQKYNLGQKVLFCDTTEEVEHFYDSIDILIIPSLREPLGLVALEASARGVPVLATCVDGLAESVHDGVSGFLIEATEPIQKGECISSLSGLPDVVYDPVSKSMQAPKMPTGHAFAKRIYDILTTKGLYEQISAGGIQVAHERADFSKYCKDLLQIFHSEAEKYIEQDDNTEET